MALSIRVAEAALSSTPPAGVLTPEEFAEHIPDNEQSVMIDIANLDRNRVLLASRCRSTTRRATLWPAFPILLASRIHPGLVLRADPSELGKLVAGPSRRSSTNIVRVREPITPTPQGLEHAVTSCGSPESALGVRHETLLAVIDTRIEETQRDEAFLGWVKAALAIATTIAGRDHLHARCRCRRRRGLGRRVICYGSIVVNYLDESAATRSRSIRPSRTSHSTSRA